VIHTAQNGGFSTTPPGGAVVAAVGVGGVTAGAVVVAAAGLPRAATPARGTGSFACAALEAGGAGTEAMASAVVVVVGVVGGAGSAAGRAAAVEGGRATAWAALGDAFQPMTPAAATAAATASPIASATGLRLRRRVPISRSAVVDAVVDASVAAVGEMSPLPKRCDTREPPVVSSFVSESACAPSWLSSRVRPSISSAGGKLPRGKPIAGSPKERAAASLKRLSAACTSLSDCGRDARSLQNLANGGSA